LTASVWPLRFAFDDDARRDWVAILVGAEVDGFECAGEHGSGLAFFHVFDLGVDDAVLVAVDCDLHVVGT